VQSLLPRVQGRGHAGGALPFATAAAAAFFAIAAATAFAIAAAAAFTIAPNGHDKPAAALAGEHDDGWRRRAPAAAVPLHVCAGQRLPSQLRLLEHRRLHCDHTELRQFRLLDLELQLQIGPQPAVRVDLH
jgi:hypothetical protein